MAKKKLRRYKSVWTNDYFKDTENYDGQNFTRGDIVLAIVAGLIIPLGLLMLILALFHYLKNIERYIEELED